MPCENFLGTILPRELAIPNDPDRAIRNALRKPVGTRSFSSMATKGERVVIVVSDQTRTTRAEIFLPILLRGLEKASLPDKDIHIVFATGAHRPHTPDEMVRIAGEEVSSRVAMHDHIASDASAHALVGFTRHGTPVRLDRRVAEADRIILTGAICYHYYAGFGGGRKSLLPGVCARDTIEQNHRLILHPERGKGLHPLTRAGVVSNNPIHDDMMDAVRLVKPDFLVNVVLDDQKRIARVFAGDPVEAHSRGCQYVDKHFGISLKTQADLVIASCGGAPKDVTFIQAHKAMDNSFGALRDGGVMILLAECAEGLGNPTLLEWFKYETIESHDAALRENYILNGHTALSLRIKTSRARVILVSRMEEDVVRRLWMEPAESLEDAIEKARSILGRATPSAYVIPEASETLARLASERE